VLIVALNRASQIHSFGQWGSRGRKFKSSHPNRQAEPAANIENHHIWFAIFFNRNEVASILSTINKNNTGKPVSFFFGMKPDRRAYPYTRNPALSLAGSAKTTWGCGEMGILNDYIVAIIVAICFSVGYIVKHSLDFIPNKYIPLIVGILGVVLNTWMNGWTFTPKVLLGGLASGLASTGAFELVRNLKGGATKL
jgi:hypothetical protein